MSARISTNIAFYPFLLHIEEPENGNCLQMLLLSCCYLQQYFGSIFSSTRVYPEFCAAEDTISPRILYIIGILDNVSFRLDND